MLDKKIIYIAAMMMSLSACTTTAKKKRVGETQRAADGDSRSGSADAYAGGIHEPAGARQR